MRAINFVSHIIDHGFDDDGRLVRTNINYIGTGDLMNNFNNSSRMNVSWDWLTFLRDDGRAKAEVWIKENLEKIGKQSTCDINNIFM